MLYQIVQCSYDQKCWYSDAIGLVLYAYPYPFDSNWFIAYNRYLLDPMPDSGPKGVFVLMVHKNDLVEWQK